MPYSHRRGLPLRNIDLRADLSLVVYFGAHAPARIVLSSYGSMCSNQQQWQAPPTPLRAATAVEEQTSATADNL